MFIVPWLFARLHIDSNPPPKIVEGGAQIKQMINTECIMEFNEQPLIDLQFRYLHFWVMYLPLAIPWGGTPGKEEDFVKFPLESANFPLVKGDIEQSQLNYPS